MYRQDREWSDTYDTKVKDIIKMLPAAYFMDIANASVERDKKCATDFTLRLTGGDIAVRLRRPGCRYRDLTLRAQRDSGAKTELAKIKEGYAFRYFYGWMDVANIITEWILVDLDKARESGLLDKDRRIIPNGDGTYFVSIPVKELRSTDSLIASDTDYLSIGRNVNTESSHAEGIERAKQRKYFNPKLPGCDI